ncbi:hypothetical protein KI387_043998 [Taxus chinensis]|uniref:Uncharacterized protein n=1 Tax=Taxus chinensis TaxID=29808 RepID=A0AA38LCP0_TAXCH|nr:hypothetical protein KI387_043998 [Taxus chinensis]
MGPRGREGGWRASRGGGARGHEAAAGRTPDGGGPCQSYLWAGGRPGAAEAAGRGKTRHGRSRAARHGGNTERRRPGRRTGGGGKQRGPRRLRRSRRGRRGRSNRAGRRGGRTPSLWGEREEGEGKLRRGGAAGGKETGKGGRRIRTAAARTAQERHDQAPSAAAGGRHQVPGVQEPRAASAGKVGNQGQHDHKDKVQQNLKVPRRGMVKPQRRRDDVRSYAEGWECTAMIKRVWNKSP